jgi:hypothetical protein
MRWQNTYLCHSKCCSWVLCIEKSDKVQVVLKRNAASMAGGGRGVRLAVMDDPDCEEMRKRSAFVDDEVMGAPCVEILGRKSGGGRRGDE